MILMRNLKASEMKMNWFYMQNSDIAQYATKINLCDPNTARSATDASTPMIIIALGQVTVWVN